MSNADHPHEMTKDEQGAPGGTARAVDPVCHMSVDPQTAQHVGEHDGTTYYFCAAGCKKAFLADPGRFLKPSPAAPPAGATMLQMGRAGNDAGRA